MFGACRAEVLIKQMIIKVSTIFLAQILKGLKETDHPPEDGFSPLEFWVQGVKIKTNSKAEDDILKLYQHDIYHEKFIP